MGTNTNPPLSRGASLPRAPMPAPPARQYSFTDWQANNPNAPPPGNKLDSEYDNTNASVSGLITWASTSLNTDGTVRDAAIGQNQLQPGLFDNIASGIIDEVQPLVDQATAAADSALASANTAQTSASQAAAQAAVANAAASYAQASETSASHDADAAAQSAADAGSWSTEADNAANHALQSENTGYSYAILAQAWAEHMPDNIPPNILAAMDITGAHWSARWWAEQAQEIVGGPYLPLNGSEQMQGPLLLYGPPSQGNEAVSKQYVDDLINSVASSSGLYYRGNWKVAANDPDLTGGSPTGGDFYLAITADPFVPETAPAGIPGIGGQTIENQARIVWNNQSGAWEMIPPGRDYAVTDQRYLQLSGANSMLGPLILHGDATQPLQAVTFEQLNSVSGAIPLPGNVAPLMDQPGAGIGTSTRFARQDHVHPSDSTKLSKTQADALYLTPAQGNARYLQLSGGTMTGTFLLAVDPTQNLEAATKQYVDAAAVPVRISDAPPANPHVGALWWCSVDGQLYIRYQDPDTVQWVAASNPPALGEAPTDGLVYGRQNAAWHQVLPIAGGALTGPLSLAGDPTTPLGAATKQYVDNHYLPLTGGTLSGWLWTTGVSAGGNGINYSAANTVAGVSNNAIAFGWNGSTAVLFVDGTDAGPLATQTYVQNYGGNFLPLAGGTITGSLHVNGTFQNDGSRIISVGGGNNPSVTVWDYNAGAAAGMWLGGGPVLAFGATDGNGVPSAGWMWVTSPGILTANQDLRANNAVYPSVSRNPGFYLYDDGNYAYINFTTDAWRIAFTHSSGTLFYASSSGAVLWTVDGSGNLWAAASITAGVNVSAGAALIGNNLSFHDQPGGNHLWSLLWEYQIAGTASINVDSGGVVYPLANAWSDERMKAQIAPAKFDGLAAVLATPLWQFKRKSHAEPGFPSDDETKMSDLVPIGFVAQRTLEAFPEAVTAPPPAIGLKALPGQKRGALGGIWGFDPLVLTAAAYDAIKQLHARVAALEAVARA